MPTLAQQRPSNPTLNAVLRKTFSSREAGFCLDVEFRAAAGFTILFGPSGSGKTTLLDCVAGLTTPDAGRIALDERLLFDANTHVDMPVARRSVGYVLQDLALFPHLTAEQNIAYGLAHLPRSTRRQRVLDVLQEFRIDHLRQ